MKIKDAFQVNKQTWNQKTAIHYESEFYDKSAFAKAKNSLKPYELKALGDVIGKSLLHLQCHFGQDSLSWAHKGAVVTAVDFSESAIDQARQLSMELEIPANFLCCNVLDVSNHITDTFDIIFTSYGVICWLPDLKPWAQMIARRLKKEGIFYMVEFHPIAWMFDYNAESPLMKFSYALKDRIYEEYRGTYADENAAITSKEYSWNHSLSEVIQSLIDAGLQIEYFAEHDESPYRIFPEMEAVSDMYVLKHKLYPTIFELKAKQLL
ncbi:class I SAM-dependent methyltransferase [Nonlabens antarcticus]|uniref:class I SAM-dependent methyltransferase n=1 Tax=Nonlabens antarcticus TaxID=392714 RepID=UPI0018911E2A|nr:class I SAM-dependent methyltransferase [Nonlabens antarcticus]